MDGFGNLSGRVDAIGLSINLLDLILGDHSVSVRELMAVLDQASGIQQKQRVLSA